MVVEFPQDPLYLMVMDLAEAVALVVKADPMLVLVVMVLLFLLLPVLYSLPCQHHGKML
jgi:hypothetical protein|tara:strand:- start:185 stop:361 length:177 start_codon:yes stop_codon:yes gene_type:complete